jgi:DNA-3-methyladenine glycosylase
VTARRRRGRVLTRAFYGRPTLEVARDLIGKVLVHRTPEGLTSGAIVETEAYIGESDPACHAAPGPTRRNEPLYGEPGRAYVYFNYGVHYLVNAVTERRGYPAAVLIRALEPIEGVDVMRSRRGHRSSGAEIPEHELCKGPGNLARAMGIAAGQNRADLTQAAGSALHAGLWIEDRGVVVADVRWTPRIGIRLGTAHAWRCCVPGHPSVSGRRVVGIIRKQPVVSSQ